MEFQKFGKKASVEEVLGESKERFLEWRSHDLTFLAAIQNV